MSDPLAILLGNQARVKLMRFFLFNQDEEFLFEDIARRARLVRRTARTEINILERAKLIKKKVVYVSQEGKKNKLKTQAYVVNKDFPLLRQFHRFFSDTAPLNGQTILKQLRKVGKLDVVVAAGIFVDHPEQRVDLLVAMKHPSVSKVETAIRGIEAELGMDIRFTLLSTEDLEYRLGMYDKHTRDVFDFPHDILIDKIGLKNELAGPWVM